jgi:ABC-2 type transport system ATP-binding protein
VAPRQIIEHMSHLRNITPLTIDQISKRYGSVAAVEHLSVTVNAGEVVAIVGPNGSGKSTALNMVVGLRTPDAGVISVCGHPRGSLAARASTAYVPDNPAGLDELTVGEFLDLYAALYRLGKGFEVRAAVLLDAFGLASRTRSALGTLSNGMRRLTTMIAAIAAAPPLVVVDEATAGLDPEAVILFREAIVALSRRGSGVLLATQDLHFAEAVSDRAYLLSAGSVVADGAVGDLRRRYRTGSLEGVFLHALGTPNLVEEVRVALDAV